MTSAPHTSDPSFIVESRLDGNTQGVRRTFAVITCRTCGATDDASLKDKNIGWARRTFKSRGWTVADRPGRHQCPTCAQGPRGLGGKSVREVTLSTSKHPWSADRHDLLNDSSLVNGVMELALVKGNNLSGPAAAQEIDPDLLNPDRMAEALSHLGHVTKHVEPPPMPTPRGRWKGRVSSAYAISAKPPNLPAFFLPPKPAYQHKRKTGGHRFPSDAAITARSYLKACGIPIPQVGRDYIIWAAGHDIGWAPLPPETVAIPVPAPEPTPAPVPEPELAFTTTVEPVAPSEEPMPAPTLSATPPSRPTREKLLAIHEKLNAIYLTEGAGRYTGVWSDAKVADELDVPAAWVIEERSRVYGEGAGNESSNIALDKWRRDMTNRMAKAVERQVKAIEELLTVNTEIEAIKKLVSSGPAEGA